MKHHTNKANRETHDTNGEPRAYGMWEPKVNVKLNGKRNATLRRKVVTNGVKFYAVPLKEIVKDLRQGFEVRLGMNGEGSIRVYPCLDKDYRAIFPAADTMGVFRDKAYEGIDFEIRHRGEEIGAEECERAAAENHAGRESACPVRMVECPKCGYEFEISGMKPGK